VDEHQPLYSSMPARTSGLGKREPADKDKSDMDMGDDKDSYTQDYKDSYMEDYTAEKRYMEYREDQTYGYNGMQSLYSSVPVAPTRMRDKQALEHYGNRHLI
jgi:hypothetical protein